MVRHWAGQGHEVHMLFAGSLYEPELPAFLQLPVASATASGQHVLQPQGPQGMLASPDRLRALANWMRRGLKLAVHVSALTMRRLGHGRLSHGGHFHYRWRLALHEPTLRDFWRPEVRARFAMLFRAHAPDIVVIEYLRMTYVLDALSPAERSNVVCIADTHDVICERRARFHAMGVVSDIALTPAEESRLLSRFDAVLAIQARDAKMFSRLCPAARVLVAGHPVNLASCRTRESGTALRCLFLGSAMAPNVDAAKRLLTSVWPRVLSQLAPGECKLSIAGDVCSALVGQSIPDAVVLLGHVSSLEDAFTSHDAFVSPIEMGGGLKIKNVEALSAGLALITSPQGAEGLEDGVGTAFSLAHEDEEYVNTIVRWARDRAFLLRCQLEAGAYADRRFGPEVAYQELDGLFLELAARSSH